MNAKTFIPAAMFLIAVSSFGQSRPHRHRSSASQRVPIHTYYDSTSSRPQHSTVDPVSLLPMRRYASADSAARAAIRSTNPLSVRQNREIAGRVVRHRDGKYSTTVGPQWGRGLSSSVPGPVPSGTRNAGIWHDHGGPDPRFDNEHFSGVTGDKGLARREREPIYLGTPGGKVEKYSPRTNRVSSLGRTPH